MNYRVQSNTGWSKRASTQAEAESIARAHASEWAQCGRHSYGVTVKVYYDGCAEACYVVTAGDMAAESK
jgi:hypothetical protein